MLLDEWRGWTNGGVEVKNGGINEDGYFLSLKDVELKIMNPLLLFLTEILGTFLLIVTILMTDGNALAIGLALAVAVYFGGKVSGGHFNPAVSSVMWLKESINGAQWFMYVIAQLIGGFLAYGYYMAASSKTSVVASNKSQ